jgi:aryl-alcohol dehydrogenase-like predicted oxidoreductase
MHHPAVTAPIIGARNSVQLQESLQAVNIDMSAALREQISALSLEPAPAHDRLEEIIDPSTRLR